jgi:hypothetical protein
VYDPASGTWSATGAPALLRSQHTATLLPNGKVLVSGGVGIDKPAEVYDPGSGTWDAAGFMFEYHGVHTATLLPNGKVLIAGALGYGPNLAELYTP